MGGGAGVPAPSSEDAGDAERWIAELRNNHGKAAIVTVLHASPRTKQAAAGTCSLATQRVGLRWKLSLPSKRPKICCILGESTLSGFPAWSRPITLIFTAFVRNRLPQPPLTNTKRSR